MAAPLDALTSLSSYSRCYNYALTFAIKPSVNWVRRLTRECRKRGFTKNKPHRLSRQRRVKRAIRRGSLPRLRARRRKAYTWMQRLWRSIKSWFPRACKWLWKWSGDDSNPLDLLRRVLIFGGSVVLLILILQMLWGEIEVLANHVR